MMEAVSHAVAKFLHRRKRPNFVSEIYIKYSNARDIRDKNWFRLIMLFIF